MPVRLQQQPFQVLAALLERPGELVTAHDLQRRLWPEGTHVAFERGLASALRKLREALGDGARSPVYVETLARRGYRFIAPVSVVAPGARPSTRTVSIRWAAVLLLGVLSSGLGQAPSSDDGRLQAAESLSAYACLLKSRGEMNEALAVIRRAHALVPASARIAAEVGFYSHAAGRYDDEFPMLQRAAALDASSPEVWWHMGLAYARRQDFGNAVASLERASRLAETDSRIDWWLTWARQQRSTAAS
jgi:tetratricopeptide (TPR) repeat protein